MGRLRDTSIAVLLAIAAVPTLPAAAAHLELQGGRSYMDTESTNAAFVEAVFNGHRIGDSRWRWSPDVSLGWVKGRDVARYNDARYTTRDDVWLFAAGPRFQYGDDADWCHHFFFSMQPAVTSGRTQALSSGYEFVSTAGWQGQHLSFQIRHISNAGLHNPNRGETMALIGVGFDL
ncbi:MAG: acyloxyacyl hydrolase [Pseudomonadota bacterium]|nr:acyloxyacyl hydrolase [Pseudomonadota bacterium]